MNGARRAGGLASLGCACLANLAEAQPRRRPPPRVTTPVRRGAPRVVETHVRAPAEPLRAAPEPPDPVAPTAAPAETEAPARPRPDAVDIALGVTFFTRSLAWNDDLFRELRPYTLTVAPALTVRVSWYPGAHVTSSALAHLGLTASGSVALGLSSQDTAGRSFDTRASQWSLGLRGRVPLGDVCLGVTAEYLSQRFVVDLPPADNDLGVPAMEYNAVALGADARIALGAKLSLSLGARYLAVLSAGAIGDTVFPSASAGGLDAEVGMGFALARGVELRVVGGLRRYFFSLNPSPGDRWVAGGATDDYLSALVALGYRR